MSPHSTMLARALVSALCLSASATALAQHDHSQHEAAAPVQAEPAAVIVEDNAATERSATDHSSHMQHATQAPSAAHDHAAMEHAAQEQPRTPIPMLTDADRAAAFPALESHDMAHGSSLNSFVLLDRLEAWDADHGSGQAWEAQAWIGGDINRLWLRSEGEREDGRTASSDLEVLYGHSVSAWWDVVAGIRHDFRPADSRTWAALGVQGMAPYKFELAATAYLGESGHAAATLEVEYELLLTNRLILQPLVELRFNAKDDPLRRAGSGLGKIESGLRLRYEFNRQFAPYVGIVHERVFGGTADYRRAEGEGVEDTRVVAGVRIWF